MTIKRLAEENQLLIKVACGVGIGYWFATHDFFLSLMVSLSFGTLTWLIRPTVELVMESIHRAVRYWFHMWINSKKES